MLSRPCQRYQGVLGIILRIALPQCGSHSRCCVVSFTFVGSEGLHAER